MTTPVGILNHGKSYLKAARHLLDEIVTQRLSLPFDDPVSLLLGHSIELILKACLHHKIGNAPKSRDLLSLRTLAISHACVFDLDRAEQGHLGLLNNVFGGPPYKVRYLTTGVATTHDDKIILGIAARFADEATQLIPGAAR